MDKEDRGICQQKWPQGRAFDQFFSIARGLPGGLDLPQVVLNQEEKETERAKRAAEPRSASEAKHERRKY